MRRAGISEQEDKLVLGKLLGLPWGFLLLMLAISCIGFLMLYSVAQGNVETWSARQMVRFGIAVPLMLLVAVVDIRLWYQYAYAAFGASLLLLAATDMMGVIGGLGAQRWLSVGGLQFQPSEIAKVGLVLALARYYHQLHPSNILRFRSLLLPMIFIAVTAVLVLVQPNLGTACILAGAGAILLFLAGANWKFFAFGALAVVVMIPVAYTHLHDYQKKRVQTFLNPESDPRNSGYNIIQSKIAIGSGGFFGKGLLKGSQNQLSFIPEKQTDFIFSTVAEEFGFVGGMLVIILYGALIFNGLMIGALAQSTFGKLLASGIVTILFLHVFINIGMVMGLLPVVGVPLPLLSYGGTNMIATLIGFGFVLNVHVHRELKFN